MYALEHIISSIKLICLSATSLSIKFSIVIKEDEDEDDWDEDWEEVRYMRTLVL